MFIEHNKIFYKIDDVQAYYLEQKSGNFVGDLE